MSSVLERMVCPHCGHQGLQMVSDSVDLYCPGCKKNSKGRWPFSKSPRRLSVDYRNSYWPESNLIKPGDQEISTNERSSLCFKTFCIDFVVFTVFYICLNFFFPLKSISWILVIGLFIASRIADTISTKIALSFGWMELNPSLDPYDISKLISHQVTQVFIFVGISFLLGLINPWLKNYFLFVSSLTGFEAFFANLGQTFVAPRLSMTFSEQSISDVYCKFYITHVISIFLVAAITLVVFWMIF